MCSQVYSAYFQQPFQGGRCYENKLNILGVAVSGSYNAVERGSDVGGGYNGWFWLHTPLTSVLVSPRSPSVLNSHQYLSRGVGVLEAISTPGSRRMGEWGMEESAELGKYMYM